MSEPGRLFLFAGYDKDGIVDDALVYYVSALSKYGDVIVCMDNDLETAQTNKLKPFTICALAQKHGEYDFGSYKHTFQYARDKKILKNYDVIYLVNDSVFGPLHNIKKTLLELFINPREVIFHKTHTIKLNKGIFIENIAKELTKIPDNDLMLENDKSSYNLIVT